MRLARDSESIPARCRVAIVGGGLAGLELARSLDALGVQDVIVLEAGPARELRHVNVAHSPDQAIRKWLEPASDEHFHQPWRSRTPPHYTGTSGLRRRLGGRSLYWHGVTLPIESWALIEPWWPSRVVADLVDSWESGTPLYRRVQDDLARWLGDRPPPTIDVESTRALAAGFALTPTPRAVRPSATARDRWYAYSPLDQWRDPDTGRVGAATTGVQLYSGIEVVTVTASKDGVGLIARRDAAEESVEVAADAIVLAAGTVENSRLAIQALRQRGALGSPMLSGLADHIVHGIFVRLEPPHAARLMAALPPGSYFAPCEEARSNVFVDIHPLEDGALLDLQLMGEQMPSQRSCVCCDETSPWPWPVTVSTELSPEDEDVVAAQRRILGEVWRSFARALGWSAGSLTFADYNAPERTNDVILKPFDAGVPTTWSSCLGTEDHEGATLPLGGMLNDDHELTAIDGLFVAGPASFPRLGAANPALTILALARRMAAKIQSRF